MLFNIHFMHIFVDNKHLCLPTKREKGIFQVILVTENSRAKIFYMRKEA